MKEEILDITKKLYHNHLTPETATNLLLRLFDVSDSLIGKKLIWKGKEYTIVDKHNDSDFIMIDDENNSVIGLHWKDVEFDSIKLEPVTTRKDE